MTLAGLHELALGRFAGHRDVHGLSGNRVNGPGALHVGAGIGASVMPLRIGERGRREVAVFELGLPLGSFDEHHSERAPLKGRAPTERLKRQPQVEKKAAKREGRTQRGEGARRGCGKSPRGCRTRRERPAPCP